MSVNADQTFSGDSIFENIYVHGKLVAPEEAVSIFKQILVKEGMQITGDGGLPGSTLSIGYAEVYLQEQVVLLHYKLLVM